MTMCLFFCTGAVYSQYPSKKKSRRPIKHPFIPDKEENVTTREVPISFCLLLISFFAQPLTCIHITFCGNSLKGTSNPTKESL